MTTTKTDHEALYARAHQAGMTAGNTAIPTPMVVRQMGANGEVVKTYPPVMDGPCGFGWVTVRPGTSSFARFLKTKGHRKAYNGGVEIWVREFGQSYERKVAYARAFAEVLREAGINAYGGGRLD